MKRILNQLLKSYYCDTVSFFSVIVVTGLLAVRFPVLLSVIPCMIPLEFARVNGFFLLYINEELAVYLLISSNLDLLFSICFTATRGLLLGETFYFINSGHLEIEYLEVSFGL